MLSFTIIRMLLSVTVVAVTVHLLAPFGLGGLLAALMVSVGIGGLVLVAKKSDRSAIVRMCIFGAFGWVASELFRPPILGIGPSSVTEIAIPIILGVGLVCLLGSLAYRSDHSDVVSPPTQQESE